MADRPDIPAVAVKERPAACAVAEPAWQSVLVDLLRARLAAVAAAAALPAWPVAGIAAAALPASPAAGAAAAAVPAWPAAVRV